MKSLVSLRECAATAMTSSFLGFGVIGALDCWWRGAGLARGASALVVYGLVGAALAFLIALGTSLWPARLQEERFCPRTTALAATACSLSLLGTGYVLYWVHKYLLVAVPWYVGESILVTGAVLLGWFLLSVTVLLHVRRKERAMGPRRSVPYPRATRSFGAAIAAVGVLFAVCSGDGLERLALDRSSEHPLYPNVVIIVLDALRADFTSAYGYKGETTPAVDRLARDGLLFRDAQSTSSWTLPAVTSILASRLPGLQVSPGTLRAGLAGVTLPEVLARIGYVSLGVSDNPHVSGPYGFTQRFHLFDDGRSWWEHAVRGTTAGAALERLFPVHDGTLVKRTLSKIARLPRPFFLYLHLKGGHAPCRPPSEYAQAFAIPPTERIIDFPAPNLDIRPEEREVLLARYAVSLRYADDQLSLLLDALDTAGLAESTLVVVTADHGEEFSEHGGWLHGTTLYNEVLHVPLVLRWPGKVSPGTRRTETVSLLDIAPTIVAAVVPGRPELVPLDWAGVDLGITRRESPHGSSEIVAQVGPSLQALVSQRWKYILNVSTGSESLFDRWKDPGEREDLAAVQREVLAQHRLSLQSRIRQLKPILKPEGTGWVDPHWLDRLKSLGYVR